MLRTMKRLMALSLGIAFPVETHLLRKRNGLVIFDMCDGIVLLLLDIFWWVRCFSFLHFINLLDRTHHDKDLSSGSTDRWLSFSSFKAYLFLFTNSTVLHNYQSYRCIYSLILLSSFFPLSAMYPRIALVITSQVTYLTRLTCPRPFLFLPWLRLFTVMLKLFLL